MSTGLAAVSSYNHMWLPMSYGDPAAEYRRLTNLSGSAGGSSSLERAEIMTAVAQALVDPSDSTAPR